MKKMKSSYYVLAAVGLLATAGLASAQSTTTQSTTTTSSTSSAGTVSEFSPATITVRTDSAPAPVSYSYTKTTTYVDENGNPVSMETVKSGLPVTVFYSQDGDHMIASKVVVHQMPADSAVIETKKTTTTTTTSGQ